MAVPKRKISGKRRGQRWAHKALRQTHPGRCSNCGAYKQPHRVCLTCGYYNKRSVLSAGGP